VPGTRDAFTLESIERRARRFLRQAIRHGTTVVRGVVDVFPEIGMARVELLLRLKEEFAPYLDLRPSHVLLICISIPAAWYDLSILTGSYL
jgi:cytosine/adenosine deaminase-related metal-dependent hydrolase